MNCTHCGKKLYPEAPFCPHCGKPNEHRIELEQQVHDFDRAYAQTTNDVRTAVRRKNRFIGKIAAIVFLALLLVFSVCFGDDIASDLAYRQRTEEVNLQLDASIEEINTYLDAQDYYGLNAWLNRSTMTNWLGSAAPEYDLVLDNVRNYCEAMSSFMTYHETLRSEDSDPEQIRSRAKRVRDNLIYYYQDQGRGYRSDNPSRTDAVLQMNRNLEAMAVAYFEVPAGDAAGLSGMTEGAREVLLENYLTPTEAP